MSETFRIPPSALQTPQLTTWCKILHGPQQLPKFETQHAVLVCLARWSHRTRPLSLDLLNSKAQLAVSDLLSYAILHEFLLLVCCETWAASSILWSPQTCQKVATVQMSETGCGTSDCVSSRTHHGALPPPSPLSHVVGHLLNCETQCGVSSLLSYEIQHGLPHLPDFEVLHSTCPPSSQTRHEIPSPRHLRTHLPTRPTHEIPLALPMLRRLGSLHESLLLDAQHGYAVLALRKLAWN
eukprot:Blabericola_migrator_1__1842@NODE_14_length_24048_cov_80_277428_g11_i0_p7_GENE_NODE_14_length_24048_cov_80_277428_g11_i0NODE_14_length_24048_cov_80_277428_g11_i0_p7_ORF_typecomplete_len239_score22_82_NODE_14_length_24048_cov_80_277428_g11_i01653917255